MAKSYVLKEDCLRTHQKIDVALFGPDGRSGIVGDIAQIKNYMATSNEKKCEEEKKKFEYKRLIDGIAGGAVVAIITATLNYLPAIIKFLTH